MKKLLIALTILIAFAGLALAEPFVVADPQADATRYRMRLSSDGGATWGTWAEGLPVSNAMRFDIANTPPANYSGQAQAGANVTVTDSTTGQTTTSLRWSNSAPFVLRVPNIQTPANVAVQPPLTAGAGN